jgi:8-oxo-dGTP diphosphatase
MKAIHVVAAVIHSPARDRILIARRPDHLHQGGLWEFPGGKVDKGEEALAALRRELREEIAIAVEEASRMMAVEHRYPDKAVYLDIWEVHRFAGEPRGNEGQEIAWVAPERLADYAFPEANRAIVRALIDR